MATTDRASVNAPARRRPNWSLRTIVENVSGHPIAHFQDPPQSLPIPPVSRPKAGVAASTAPGEALPAADTRADAVPDPIEAIYPPLVGALGREYHGKEHEHDAETIARHRPGADGFASPPRIPGPLARPERLYLHYLLLHMDRLSDTALVYLGHAVEEERVHRSRSRRAPPAPASESGPNDPASV
ncbi:MAG: hypothetical protein WAN74_08265 [Thermoplasmata archaeon]